MTISFFFDNFLKMFSEILKKLLDLNVSMIISIEFYSNSFDFLISEKSKISFNASY